MRINIDKNAGFCFGVTNAIEQVEDYLASCDKLFCLGDIVHNSKEVERLRNMGLEIIKRKQFARLQDATVLLRAHGEPPETYKIARENNIRLIDATCPVVLKLQENVKKGFEETMKNNGQLVIFGKKGHAEVIGLVGQTREQAIVVSEKADLKKIDFSKPIMLFSQTTKRHDEYIEIQEVIKNKLEQAGLDHEKDFISYNTICRKVMNRQPNLERFAKEHDVILFVSGKKSSNGRMLYNFCKQQNRQSYFISDTDEIQPEWLQGAQSIGISGATSTPFWIMDKVARFVQDNV